MTTKEEGPYLDKPQPFPVDGVVTDQLIYGDGETLDEKKKKEAEYQEQMLNEEKRS